MQLPDLGWEMLYILGAGILLIALAVGVTMYMTRDRSKDRLGDEVTKDQYEHSERYEPQPRNRG